MVYELLTIDYGLWTMVYGLWTMVYGLLKANNLRHKATIRAKLTVL